MERNGIMTELINLNGSTDHGELKSVTAIVDAGDGSSREPITVNSDNPKFSVIKDKLDEYMGLMSAGRTSEALATSRELADVILTAADLAGQVSEKFEKLDLLDGRLTRKGNRVFLDYDPIDPVLEKEIVKALDENDDKTWRALAAFIDRLYHNTTEYVRDQLFTWLEAAFRDDETHGFQILPDGRFVGYKGCEYDAAGNVVSCNQGYAISNGEEHHGHIPNPKGAVVEMPRSMVQDDPSVGCSTGLHVGTWGYASNWARGAVLTVAVDPADVVSIPLDCDAQKLRCCRYEVIDVVDAPVKTIMDSSWSWDDGEDYDDDDEEDYDE